MAHGKLSRFILASILLASGAATAAAAPVDDLLATIKKVDRDGTGHPEAQRAMRELARQDASVLLAILPAFDGANPLSANWLRGAFEAIADRELRAKRPLPTAKLEVFVLDRSHDARARRLAFEWLSKVDTTAGDRLIPGMLDDPSPEFRRDAVARLIEQAGALDAEKERDAVVKIYRQALQGATDKDQVMAIVEPLRKMGEQVDLQKHFGFLIRWSVVGPFDNVGGKGFNVAYPPEEGVDLSATYKGQLGDVQWEPLSTDDEFGMIDIAKSVGPYKGAVMYAATEFVSPQPQQLELRLGTPNAWKVWVNGRLIFAREEYHRGTSLDQYRVPVKFNPGKNTLLLKVCQNEQKEDWAQDYKFQLRVCDPSGSAVLSLAAQTTREAGADAPEGR